MTYGYTSASFSGRMPMAEIADAIVQARQCTERNGCRTPRGFCSRLLNDYPEYAKLSNLPGSSTNMESVSP